MLKLVHVVPRTENAHDSSDDSEGGPNCREYCFLGKYRLGGLVFVEDFEGLRGSHLVPFQVHE